METTISLIPGQYAARTRWRTHESGAAFDQKKMPHLTDEARSFIAEQIMCVMSGPASHGGPGGLLLLGRSGFVLTPDERTCFIPIAGGLTSSSLIDGLRQNQARGERARIALCFLRHTTRRRLCVHGEATLLAAESAVPWQTPGLQWIRLQVTQAFFHCSKYIRTKVAGLTAPARERRWQLHTLLQRNVIGEELAAFLAEQALCYLCTRGGSGQHAVNHRGGRAGFLVTLPPSESAPQGSILLPDYSGNGAFEALGNIIETGQAALLVPAYSDHIALCFSGAARVQDAGALPPDIRRRCPGAERVITLAPSRIEGQAGDWSGPLAYEQARAGRVGSEAEPTSELCLL